MKVTIVRDKPIKALEIAHKVFTEVKCIVLLGSATLNINGSFYSTNLNNSKFSFN